MTVHTPHDDIHEQGLADNCGECAAAAERPWENLDRKAFADLTSRTLRNRFGGGSPQSPFGDGVAPRSNAEARAMAVVMTLLERTGRMFESTPHQVALYVRERWHVNVVVNDESV